MDLISRQDAINDIKECAEAAHDNHEWDMEQGYLNAIECIEELPSAQPEPIKVSVDREMTEEELKELKKKIADSPVVLLPSAKHEQKPGRWNFIGDNMFECTNCKVVYTTNQLNSLRNYDTDPYAPRFCPNCGAKMDEEDGDHHDNNH